MSEAGEDRLETFQDSFEDEHLQEYLDRVAKILEIRNPRYRIKSGSKTGDNYIGIVYRISIEGEKNQAPVKIETIFKVPPKDEIVRRILLIPQFFGREHTFYSEIVPIFQEFLQAKKNKQLENIPRCYLSSAVDQKEVVCLEDLRSKGFVMRDRLKQMDLSHITMALRTLGRFHALSFALRDQRPEIFLTKIASLPETAFTPAVITNEQFVARFEELSEMVNTALAEEDPKYTDRFSEYSPNALSLLKWTCDGENAEPYAVLNHGDFWMNNMLFKYDEDSPDPKDIYLLDFQLARYASPVLDISYILFCNCSQELRTKHYDELIKIYHDSLSSYLSELGSDPKKLFPFEALLAQLEKFSVHGAGMAVQLLRLFTCQTEDTQALHNADFSQLKERIHRDHFWRNTLRDTFKDLIDRNYI